MLSCSFVSVYMCRCVNVWALIVYIQALVCLCVYVCVFVCVCLCVCLYLCVDFSECTYWCLCMITYVEWSLWMIFLIIRTVATAKTTVGKQASNIFQYTGDNPKAYFRISLALNHNCRSSCYSDYICKRLTTRQCTCIDE